MDLLRRNYDLVATVSTGATFLVLDTTVGLPWWMWAAYGVVVAAQLGNRMINGWSR
ncbi:hypothetical protein H7J71_33735 [Mycolicibacterium peregrinum]|uniref:hypothetical protein n=1 Tax=Mycolicibacterium peregrinum TaxID=43304 RepID=UPI000AB419BB|nr:hypothetical protein [Mycolicibacterium peregrinum]MCV7206978.1 hypothetical protein [Mycolicibacterium peregrinum]